ncbi:MAG: ATP-binding protein [Gemmatimonadales bacterium]|nr:MAG: ATP-binding protein [Gemmatimonadales bacterium]
MAVAPSDALVGREVEWARLVEFAHQADSPASLGLVWGRRRIGKSFLLQDLCEKVGGFYHHAFRGSEAEALRDLGHRLGEDRGLGSSLALENWTEAVEALLALGRGRERLVVLDEFPYLLEHSPSLESILQRAWGPGARGRSESRTRLVLCGSAMGVMGQLLTGTAPLRGRAGMDLRLRPFDFRTARELHGIEDLETAVQTWAVVGGVAAYAREMVEGDMPSGPSDFGRWVSRRVLSPAAPLFGEVDLLLGEDPAVARARKPNLYHATLAGVALGNHAWSSLTRYVRLSGSSLQSIVRALVAAGFMDELQDPIRDNRPTYRPADPLIRFHHAVIRRHQARLTRHGADTAGLWDELVSTFRSQVLGPSFEEMARSWVTHFAARESLGGTPDHVGTTTIGVPRADTGRMEPLEVDVVVAADDAGEPGERTVLALGEAKAGAVMGLRQVERLERARRALGPRASRARLLLFGVAFREEVREEAARREDLEVVDLERIYGGA